MNPGDNHSSSADLESCENEPIRIPDAVQPYGCVLVIAPDTRTILRVSANSRNYPGLELSTPIGHSLDEILPAGIVSLVDEASQRPESHPPSRRDLDLPGRDGTEHPAMASCYRSGNHLVLEFETFSRQAETSASVFRALEQRLFELRHITGSMEILQYTVNEVSAWTGYEHVMAYRFDKDWHGEVIAEHLDGHWDSFLGHHFPASDIPAQARALYALNPMRHTPDVDYIPAPLEPETDEKLDMTWSAYRSISPIHREYMRNMGVRSSLSLSLMVDGQLWGMILCHHATPHHVSPRVRSYLQMMAQVVGDALQVALQRETEQEAEAITADIQAVLAQLDDANHSLLSSLKQRHELLDAFNADALLVRLHGQNIALGRSAPADTMHLVEQAVADEARDFPVHSDCISNRIPALSDPEHRDWLGGFLYARLARDRDDALLFLRAERARQETWAGQPEQPHSVDHDNGLPRVHPRRSFESWQKEILGCSLAWSEGHRIAAERLMSGLARHLAGEVERLLSHRANHDALTQLPNRSLLDDRLRQVFRRAERTREHLAMLFLDLDGFKPVNDYYGHEMGDRILQAVAQRFSDVVRDADTVARIGGDEFVILLEGFRDWDSARHDGAACAERLVTELEALRFEHEDIHLSCSVGIAIHPGDGDAPEALLRAADQAMYSIKRKPDQRYAFSSTV